jgi:hypothetical protein
MNDIWLEGKGIVGTEEKVTHKVKFRESSKEPRKLFLIHQH